MVIKSTWHIIVFIFLIYETVKRFMKQLGPEHKMKYIFIVQWVELLNVFVFACRARSSLHEDDIGVTFTFTWQTGRNWNFITDVSHRKCDWIIQDQATVCSFNPTPRQFSRPKWPQKAVAKDKAGKKKKNNQKFFQGSSEFLLGVPTPRWFELQKAVHAVLHAAFAMDLVVAGAHVDRVAGPLLLSHHFSPTSRAATPDGKKKR